jgi:GT2 family glycosyltransferase
MGFVSAVNSAASSCRGDFVILNSDTAVTAGWLDRFRRAARALPRAATLTPWSNNATICSLPQFCVENAWPGHDLDRWGVACADAQPQYPELPTAVGFCMWVRREAWDEVGGFDPLFSPGYGEENDFSRRVIAAGWSNHLCDDVFVAHRGGASFGGERPETKALRERNANRLSQLHPEYDRAVASFIAADPLSRLREFVCARLLNQTVSN